MSFIFPTFLYALFILAIPVLIHLFNFRKYKKVYFTNVKFLRELKQESQSKSRLKEILILVCRLLALFCLVMAFAQPYLPDNNFKIKPGNKAIGIYIDNSFSMEGINKNGSLFNNAKKRAKEIIAAFGNTDRFMLLTNDFEGKHQRMLSLEEMNDAIDEVTISPAVKQLSSVIKRQNDFLKTEGANDLRQFLISDFQKSTSDFNNLKADTLVNSVFVPVTANTADNVFIDTCWFESPVQQKGMIQKLNVRICNKSNKNIENGTLKLFINKHPSGIASFNVTAFSKTETLITFECKTEGFNYCSLTIDDYPIVFDDELFFTFNSKPGIRALIVNGKNCNTGTYFKNLMQNDSLFIFHENNEQAIDYSLFNTIHLLILNELETFSSGLIAELNKYIANGGHLAIIPPKAITSTSYAEFYSLFHLPLPGITDTNAIRTEKTDFKSGFFEGVFDQLDERMDLPLIKKRFLNSSSSKSNVQPILKLLNGETWLGELQINNASIYVFSGSLDISCTNFCKHALFVPTFYKMGIRSLKPIPPYYYTQSNAVIQIIIPSEKSEEPFHLTDLTEKTDIIPEVRTNGNRLLLFTQGQITKPGFYQLKFKENVLQAAAFNYNRLESGLEFYTHEEIENFIKEYHLVSFKNMVAGEKSLTASVRETEGNTKLWKLFIILTMIFVAAEIALIRLLK